MVVEGALVGAVLGVAAGILLAPESGKKIRSDIKKVSADFYRQMVPQVKKMKKLGEKEFYALVRKGTEKYAKAKKLTADEQAVVVDRARLFWGEIQKHLA